MTMEYLQQKSHVSDLTSDSFNNTVKGKQCQPVWLKKMVNYNDSQWSE